MAYGPHLVLSPSVFGPRVVSGKLKKMLNVQFLTGGGARRRFRSSRFLIPQWCCSMMEVQHRLRQQVHPQVLQTTQTRTQRVFNQPETRGSTKSRKAAVAEGGAEQGRADGRMRAGLWTALEGSGRPVCSS